MQDVPPTAESPRSTRTGALDAQAASARPRTRLQLLSGGSQTLTDALAVLLLAGALAALIPSAYVNLDAGYSLVWAQQVLNGQLPNYAGGPTPHPLVNMIGVPLALLGDRAEIGIAVISYLCLGAAIVITYRLAEAWWSRAVALIATGLLVTRPSLLSMGVLQYADMLFAVLSLAALLIIVKRPGATWWPLVLLALAGLQRPEAWLFAAILGGLRVVRHEQRLVPMALGAAAAPLIWMALDLAVTGDPVYSFLSTKEGTEEVDHETGLVGVATVMPERLAETIGKPTLLIGFAGLLLTVAFVRRASVVALGSLAVAAVAVTLEAGAGLPILGRYLILPGILLLIFAGAALLGWREAPRSARLPWLCVAIISAGLVAVYLPQRIEAIGTLREDVQVRQRGHDDALAILERHPPPLRCGPIAVPSRQLIPLTAYWLDRPAASVTSSQIDRPAFGTYLVPVDPEVRRRFTFERNDVPRTDPRQRLVTAPPRFRPGPANRSWRLYERCPS